MYVKDGWMDGWMDGGVVVRPIANLPQNVTRSRRAGVRDAGSVGCNFEMGSKVVEDLMEFGNALPRLCLFLGLFRVSTKGHLTQGEEGVGNFRHSPEWGVRGDTSNTVEATGTTDCSREQVA